MNGKVWKTVGIRGSGISHTSVQRVFSTEPGSSGKSTGRLLAWGVLALLLFLVAYGVASANPAHQQISKLSESDRAKTFSALLTSSGESCRSVTRTFYQGSDKNGNAFWNVECSGGKSWAVLVRNNQTGSTQLLECSVLKAMNAGTCFKKF